MTVPYVNACRGSIGWGRVVAKQCHFNSALPYLCRSFSFPDVLKKYSGTEILEHPCYGGVEILANG